MTYKVPDYLAGLDIDKPVPVMGYGRSRDGKVVVVERYHLGELCTYGIETGPCMCERAWRGGVVMMCFMCSGPETIRTLLYTSGDL